MKNKTPVMVIAARLGKLSELWLKKNYPFRKKAVRRLVKNSHFSEAASEALMDSLFKELTGPKLIRLLRSEFRDPKVLDEFRHDPVSGHCHRAHGPKLITHIFAGNVPNPSILSFILGVLLKSTNVCKLSSRDEGFLDVYLDSLRNFDKDLARGHLLLDPKDRLLLTKYIQRSDLVIAYGTNETLKKIRDSVPGNVAFVGYGHRVSYAFFAKEVLKKSGVRELARCAARDIWMLDRRGCLSPAGIYAEDGGEVSAGNFHIAIMEELENFEISSERLYQLKDWLKIGSLKGDFFKNLKKVPGAIQCVALEASGTRRKLIAEKLSEMGANRICRAGEMQAPPITWHHDGKLNLASWVTWTDLEE